MNSGRKKMDSRQDAKRAKSPDSEILGIPPWRTWRLGERIFLAEAQVADQPAAATSATYSTGPVGAPVGEPPGGSRLIAI
jgi:hypothetical protein